MMIGVATDVKQNTAVVAGGGPAMLGGYYREPESGFPLTRAVTIVFFVKLCLSYSTHATVTSDTIVTMRM